MTTNTHVDEVPGLAHPRVGDSLAQRYRLEKVSEHNEAGLVFDATDRHTNRRVAIEVATSLREPEAWALWQKDALTAQKLEGAHVLRVFDVGVLANGIPYLVRERYLSTLSTELQVREHLPIPQAVAWTLEIAEAIAEAHANGDAHGDLRADNVFVARGGDGVVVKVGWATAAKAEGAAKVDAARDIAGLGAILRQLATGHPSESDGAPTLPTELAQAVARALTPDPSASFANVSEFAQTIAPYAPPGHPSSKTIAFLLSRAGILKPLEPVPMKPRASMPSIPPVSLRDGWFDRPSREAAVAVAADLAPPKRPSRSVAFAAVSVGLIAAVLGGSWLLFSSDKLPRWTGAAPPEETSTTQVTSAAMDPTPTTTGSDTTQDPSTLGAVDAGLVPIELPSTAAPLEAARPALRPSDTPARASTRPDPASVPVSSLPDAPANPAPSPAPAGATPVIPPSTSPVPSPTDTPASTESTPRSTTVPETFSSPD